MIIIDWLVEQTISAEGGGDTLQQNSGILHLDGAVSESYVAEAEVTTHPLEFGSSISDHVRPRNRQISLDCVISAWSTDDRLTRRTPAAVREQLEYLRTSAALCNVVSGDIIYYDMIVTAVRETRNQRSGDGLAIVVDLVEIRRVATQTVAVPSPRVERARARSRTATQSTPTVSSVTTATAPPAAESRTSTLNEMQTTSQSVLARLFE